MAVDMTAPFVWGSGGRRLTPEEILMERKAATALGSEAMSTAPVGHWSQGLNRVLQGLMAGYDSYSADQASKVNGAESSAVIQALLGGGSAPAAAPVAATPAPMVTSPMGSAGIPAGREEFVNSIMPMAQEASAKTGLDPRLIVAQAALESGWGKSAPGNNLFGIKSHGVPGGNTMATTEVINGQPVTVQDSFRAYASPADSVKGYADFMTQNPRYEPVRTAQGLEAQVAALGKSGYATDPAYAQKVMQIAQNLPAPAAAPATARPSINPAIVQAISSPYMSDSAKKIGTMLFQNNLEQQQKANDPLRQGQIAALPVELKGKQLANMKLERELQGEGAQPLTAEERTAYGIPSTQSAYKTRSGEIKFGPAGTNVNVDTGTIPQGYQAVRDANGRVTRYEVIPGGPEDKTKQDAAKAENRATSTDIITGAASKAREAIKGATLPATGTMGSVLSNLGETGAAEVYRQVDAIKANAKVEALQAMRAASPTGGALGAVSDSENAMLAAKAGALDPKSPNFLRDLADYERTLLRVIHGKEAGDQIYDKSRPDVGWQDVGGVKIRKKQ